MKKGHEIASDIRSTVNTYKEAISKGLKEAWGIAKGILTSVENKMVEKEHVVHEDIQQNWAQSCLGNVGEVDVCAFEVAQV